MTFWRLDDECKLNTEAEHIETLKGTIEAIKERVVRKVDKELRKQGLKV